MKSLRIIIVVLFSISLLLAQTKKEEEKKKKEKEYAYDHQEIIVTAKKEPITEISNIKEIKGEEIEKRGANDPVQALETIPGIFYTVGSRGETILQIRGFSQRQIITMIDGIPIYVPYDGQVDLSHFPVEGLAKIKVIKGTSSTIYGSNSMGGIINLITEAPTQKTRARLSLNLGSNVNQKIAFSLGKKWERIGFWISGEYKNSDGFYLPKKFESDKNEDGRLRQNSDLTNKGVNGRVHYSWEKGSLFFDFNLIDSKKGIPPHVAEDRPRYWRFPVWRKNEVKISLKHILFSELELRGSVYYDLYKNTLDSYDDSTYTTQDKKYSFHSTFDDYSIGANFFGDLSKGINHLRIGLNLKKDVHRSQANYYEPWEKYEAANYSLGLENEISINKNTSLVIGTSLDWLKPLYSNGGELRPSIFHVNPLFGVSYRINLSQIYFSVAKKSRFPTLKEFYSEYLGRNIPNPDLREEKAMNYELGFRSHLSQKGTLEISLFYSDLKDLIVQKRIEMIYQMQNVNQADYLGAEFSLDYEIQKGYDLSISYSYLRARDTSLERKSSRLEYKPPHKLALILNFNLPLALEGMAKALFINKRYFEDRGGEFKPLSPYTLLDLRISKKLGNLEIYLLLKNLMDEYYEFEEGFPGPGREFIVGITWKRQTRKE